jgi:glycosyltransferase involved in cell wall biosynthesis
MRRFRVLVLCDSVDRAGGTESYLSRVVPALARRGLDVRIAARRVVELDAFGCVASEIGWGADGERSSEAGAAAVAELIRMWRPDAVVASNVYDAAVMRVARLAPYLLVRVHDHRVFCPQGDRQFPHTRALCTNAMRTSTCLGNALVRGCAAGASLKTLRLVRDRIALRDAALRADHFVTASQFVADLCALNGVTAERLSVVVPPYGKDRVAAAAPRPERDRVLFAGRLVRDKGLRSLIEALGKLPRDVRPELAVAGAPTRDSQPLPDLAARLGVRLTMLGQLNSSELNAAIDASSLVAVPSLWPEPFGLVGIEAQARGRPVVAYDVGGISEWMGEAGILVPRGDEGAFARAIATVLEPARWSAFSAAALRQAAKYSIDAHVDSLLDVIALEAGRETVVS